MNNEHIQSLRYKLQRRIRRIKSSGWQQYPIALQQFWSFFDSEPLLRAIALELEARFKSGTSIVSELKATIQRGNFPIIANEGEWAAASYSVLREFASQDPRAVRHYVPMQSSSSFDDHLEAFNSFFLDPFYDFVDERLDDPRFLLAQLVRFKHLCEWFWRTELYNDWSDNQTRGEKRLGMKLYEFLFQVGIAIHIEPWSASGEADLISSQEGEERLLADVKIFNPEKNKSAAYILQGFRQVCQYAHDYNEAIAYLLIFNTSNKQLQIATESGSDLIPRVTANHKTVFFLIIDLYPHETSASKRPQPEIVQITEEEIAQAATPAREDGE